MCKNINDKFQKVIIHGIEYLYLDIINSKQERKKIYGKTVEDLIRKTNDEGVLKNYIDIFGEEKVAAVVAAVDNLKSEKKNFSTSVTRVNGVTRYLGIIDINGRNKRVICDTEEELLAKIDEILSLPNPEQCLKHRKIRKVKLNSAYRYIYDLPKDILGREKRLTDKTLEGLENKISEEEQKKPYLYDGVKTALPRKNDSLENYMDFIFKNSVMSDSKRERLTHLFERAVYNSSVNRNINSISVEEFNEYFNALKLIYEYDLIVDIYENIKKVYILYSILYSIEIDFDVAYPEESPTKFREYLLNEKEYKDYLSYVMEYKAIKNNLSNLYAIIFLMQTGQRMKDILKIKNKDFDLEKGTVIIDDKIIILDKNTVEWLKIESEADRLNIAKTEAENELWVSNSKGNALYTNAVDRTIESISYIFGFPQGITFLSLRTAFIANKLNSGVSKEELALQLGLKDNKTIEDAQKKYAEFQEFRNNSLSVVFGRGESDKK